MENMPEEASPYHIRDAGCSLSSPSSSSSFSSSSSSFSSSFSSFSSSSLPLLSFCSLAVPASSSGAVARAAAGMGGWSLRCCHHRHQRHQHQPNHPKCLQKSSAGQCSYYWSVSIFWQSYQWDNRAWLCLYWDSCEAGQWCWWWAWKPSGGCCSSSSCPSWSWATPTPSDCTTTCSATTTGWSGDFCCCCSSWSAGRLETLSLSFIQGTYLVSMFNLEMFKLLDTFLLFAK